MKYLVSDHTSSGSLIGLAPFETSDWPIAWRWMLSSWKFLADDFMLPDLSLFLRLKEEQNAIHLGVYRDDELGGLLMFEPMSPWLCQCHAVFRPAKERRDWDKDALVTSLELGKRFAWGAGYGKIAAVTFEDNTLLIRLIERIGGVLEGRFEQETFREDQLVTMVRYGIFREMEPSS